LVVFLKKLKKILTSKLIFYIPKKCKIVHLGIDIDKNIFHPYFNNEPIEVIPTLSESINLFFLIKTILFLLKKNYIKNYYSSYIKFINPKIVFSTSDNFTYFYTISKNFDSLKTILIQNGRRSENLDIFSKIEPNNSYYVDYSFVFGESIGKKFSQYIKGPKISIGSFLNNHFYSFQKNSSKNLEDVFFISSWRSNLNGLFDKNGNSVSYDSYFSTYFLVVQFLIKWCINNNKKLNICLSSLEDSNQRDLEIDFYKNISNITNYSLILRKNRYSSYKLLNREGVFVFIDTTLGLEALARGKRTAALSILGYIMNWNDWKFGWPEKLPDYGPFWCNRIDIEYYSKILKFLFEVNERDWTEIRKKHISTMIEYDYKNKKLKKIIKNIL